MKWSKEGDEFLVLLYRRIEKKNQKWQWKFTRPKRNYFVSIIRSLSSFITSRMLNFTVWHLESFYFLRRVLLFPRLLFFLSMRLSLCQIFKMFVFFSSFFRNNIWRQLNLACSVIYVKLFYICYLYVLAHYF